MSTYIKATFYDLPNRLFEDAHGGAYCGGFFTTAISSVVGFALDEIRQATQIQLTDGSTVLLLKSIDEVETELKAARLSGAVEIDWISASFDQAGLDEMYQREETARRQQEATQRQQAKLGGTGSDFGRAGRKKGRFSIFGR